MFKNNKHELWKVLVIT